MGLQADLVVSSTDPEIDRLKPDPKGLLYICDHLGVSPADCLFSVIGRKWMESVQ